MSRLKTTAIIVVTMLAARSALWPVNSLAIVYPASQVRSAADQNSDVVISDANFAIIAQQIRDLKNPTFRALLRVRLVSWVTPSDRTDKRQAAIEVATEALSDLCANQDDIWRPTSKLFYESLNRSVRRLDPDGAEVIMARFTLKKDESVSDPARDFAAAVNALNDPSKTGEASEKAKAALLTGKVPADSLLGALLRLQTTNPAGLPDLLAATLTVEEQQPGFIPLQLIPFFTPIFLAKSNPAELQERFLLAAIRSTRLRPEDVANSTTRNQVVQTLRGISESTKTIAPALYPEVATRLNALGDESGSSKSQRREAEERIRSSSDQLGQIESEAEKTTDKSYKNELFGRAARLALTQGKLRKAVDLALASRPEEASDSSTSIDRFLGEIIRAALKQNQPEVSVYAISKIAKPIHRANGMLAVGKYYTDIKEVEKSRTALNDSAKLLKQADNDNDKLKAGIALGQSLLAHDRAASYDAFRQVVETINKLPAPEKEKQKMYYVSLMPIAEELIKSFRLLAAQDGAEALVIAQEIKLSELRVAALSGVYSSQRSSSAQIQN